MTKNYIVATAGHVDHGKSALVKALTGLDPDRLPEEKARGITIDLGFAHLTLSPSGAEDTKLNIGIIDVPGHEDLVKNMVAGLAAVDLALLAIAADDGWMPQTEEHLQILTYLRVPRLVVAVTKADLVGPKLPEVTAAIRQQLQDSPYPNAELVPTSVVTHQGLERLKQVVARLLVQGEPQPDIGKPRLPIDRVFTLPGIGTVVTGTLSGGCFVPGQEVVVHPGGERARIRGLQSHNQEVPRAEPGTRTALNLVTVSGSAPGAKSGANLRRGAVVTLPGTGSAHSICDVCVERSARPAKRLHGGLKHGLRVCVHLGTGVTPARIFFPDARSLEPGPSGIAQLRFETPVLAFASDRFVIRDWSEQLTLAGGVVLDPEASTTEFRSQSQQEFLQGRTNTLDSAPDAVDALVRRDGAVQRNALLVKSRFSAVAIEEAVSQAIRSKRVIGAGGLLMNPERWAQLVKKAGALIRAHHQQHPEEPGISMARLTSLLAADNAPPELVKPIIEALLAEGFAQTGGSLQDKTHRPALRPQLQSVAAKMRRTLETKAFDPPARRELAPDTAGQEALRFLIETGEIVPLSAELVLDARVFARAKEGVVQFIRRHGPSSVSQLREALAASRRIVVPLLERLDRDGLTRREMQLRVLRGEADERVTR